MVGGRYDVFHTRSARTRHLIFRIHPGRGDPKKCSIRALNRFDLDRNATIERHATQGVDVLGARQVVDVGV
jgi:ribosome biogenesis protein Tsr3